MEDMLKAIMCKLENLDNKVDECFNKVDGRLDRIENDIKELREKTVPIGDTIVSGGENLNNKIEKIREDIADMKIVVSMNLFDIIVLKNNKTQ